MLLPGASNRIQIHLKPQLLLQLALELELRHTEGVRTLLEEQMVFQLTGEALAEEMPAGVVAEEEVEEVVQAPVPRMITGAEITINHG